jgi:hypothetical protein
MSNITLLLIAQVHSSFAGKLIIRMSRRSVLGWPSTMPGYRVVSGLVVLGLLCVVPMGPEPEPARRQPSDQPDQLLHRPHGTSMMQLAAMLMGQAETGGRVITDRKGPTRRGCLRLCKSSCYSG